jgi:acetolactate synthase-1/3 small subunit
VPREEIKRTTDIFRGQIVDVGPRVYTIQLAGTYGQARFLRAR